MSEAPPALPMLDNLVGVFFGQDMDLFGDSVAAVLDEFVATSGPDDWSGLRAEIAAFLMAHADGERDAAFAARWQHDFDPASWDLDAAGFLGLVDTRMAQALAAAGG